MSAFEEILHRGDAAGAETIALLRRLGAQTARRSTFPPPQGHRSWTSEAVDDLLAELFASRGSAFVVACRTTATDQGSLERLILKTIKNFLIDQAKATERGKLRRRLGRILGDDARFERPALLRSILAWALFGGPTGLWQGELDQLHRSAAGVRGFQIATWNTAGRTSAGNVEAITGVSWVVIDFAAGAVLDDDLAQVLEVRFALLAQPMFEVLPDGRYDIADTAGFDPVQAEALRTSHVGRRAQELLDGLSAEEQALLPYLAASLRTRMSASGLGRATTEALTATLAERLRQATQDDDERDEILVLLADMLGGAR